MQDRIKYTVGAGRHGTRRSVKYAALTVLACAALIGVMGGEAHAAVWLNRANNVKVVVTGNSADYGGHQGDAWALSATVGPNGGQKVLIGDWFFDGNGENPYVQWFVDGDAEATALTTSAGRPWVVGKDNSVWFRTTASWFSMPTQRCEGNGTPITIRQVVGDNSIAVAHNTHAYVIESNGSPGNSVRWWNGSCWYRMPSPPGEPTDVAIWPIGPAAERIWPWIATTSGALYRWDGGSWVTITFGTAFGVGASGAVLGSDGTSIWRLNAAGTSFSRDVDWGGSAIRNVGDNHWVVRPDGRAFHRE